MKTKIESIYLTVRVDVEVPEDSDDSFIDDVVVPEVDYSFKERDSEERFKVVNTEICGRNMM